jgi:hypothetical protein
MANAKSVVDERVESTGDHGTTSLSERDGVFAHAWFKLALIAAVFLALTTCCLFTPWARSFPLNDGGFWFVFASKITQAGYSLPTSVSFNGSELPVTYPPAAGYLLAGLSDLTGVGILRLQVWLPMTAYVIAVGIFTYLSFSYFASQSVAVLSSLLFPLLMYSHRWVVMGGGVSRGLGLVFQLWIWTVASQLGRRSGVWRHVLLGILLACLVLSHPIGALWGVLGRIILGWGAFQYLGLEVASCLLFLAPWLVVMWSRHGLEPYLHAFGSSGVFVNPLSALLFDPQRFAGGDLVLGGFLVFGLLTLICRGMFQLPILFVAGVVLDPRGLSLHNGAVVVCMTIAVGVVSSFEVMGGAHVRTTVTPSTPTAISAEVRRLVHIVGVFILGALLTQGVVRSWASTASIFTLSGKETIKDMLQYANRADSVGDVVFVGELGVGEGWPEWLAVLSGHRVLNLHQMTEWHGRFNNSIAMNLYASEYCCHSNSLLCPYKPSTPTDAFIIERGSCEVFRQRLLSHDACRELFVSPGFSRIACDGVKDAAVLVQGRRYQFPWPRDSFTK